MKVLHVCYSNKGGGGAIGAYRLHSAMLYQGIDSRLLVIKKRSYDPTLVRAPFLVRIANLIARILSRYILLLQKPDDRSYRSLNIFPIGISKFINSLDADIVQLHWINQNTIGISELKHIRKPIVWKLPDMWSFSGCEHYPTNSKRPYIGYSRLNRPAGARGLDIDRYVWNMKIKHWKDINLTIVTPSKWLADYARTSYLFRHYPVYNIPNPINLEVFRPSKNRDKVRSFLKLPHDKKLILFTSITLLNDPRKGFGFLEKCMQRLAEKSNPLDYTIIIMGYEVPYDNLGGIELINLGYIQDELNIAMVYSAVDVCATPSYADNLPNTIKEAMACGTPCVAFNTGGMPDMITHKVNGFLASVDNIEEFCDGLIWALSSNYPALSAAAREAACNLHNPETIIKQYTDVYKTVITGNVATS